MRVGGQYYGSIKNKFYVDNENSSEMFGQFIGQELVQMIRKMFHLSHKREDTFIAGLSMGGYGAIISGLKYCHTFGYVAGLSSLYYLMIGFKPKILYFQSKMLKSIMKVFWVT